MAEIRHRVGVRARIEDVYEAVATPKGVARWWAEDVVTPWPCDENISSWNRSR
jgi:uncharacterized protein YndB with AHSA1/START domain